MFACFTSRTEREGGAGPTERLLAPTTFPAWLLHCASQGQPLGLTEWPVMQSNSQLDLAISSLVYNRFYILLHNV